MKAKQSTPRAKAAPARTTKPTATKRDSGTTKKSAGTAAKPRSSSTSRRTATPARPARKSSGSPSDLLRAGLNALSLPRAESAVAGGLSRIADSFGLKKLEDVFDHRVAAAMERIGYPSARELQVLSDQVAELIKLMKAKSGKNRG